MPPVVSIVHQVRGRVRLRVREKRQDDPYFEETRTILEALPGIEQVTFNSTTGSIVLQHGLHDNDELLTRLSGSGLFEFNDSIEPTGPAIESLRSSLYGIGSLVKAGTAGSVDLRTVAFIAMMGLTLHQVLRGQVLGPALPMLWNAFSLIDRNTKTQPEPGPDPEDG